MWHILQTKVRYCFSLFSPCMHKCIPSNGKIKKNVSIIVASSAWWDHTAPQGTGNQLNNSVYLRNCQRPRLLQWTLSTRIIQCKLFWDWGVLMVAIFHPVLRLQKKNIIETSCRVAFSDFKSQIWKKKSPSFHLALGSCTWNHAACLTLFYSRVDGKRALVRSLRLSAVLLF